MGGRAWTAEHARSVLGAWEESGLSGTAYARSIGVIAQRLFWWRRRLAEGGTELAGKATFVPVIVRGAPASAGLAPVVVTTRAGARIEVNDVEAATAGWVAAVLRGEERS